MSTVLDAVEQESNRRREDRDCAVRAVAIAADYEYDDVHYVFGRCGRVSRRGTQWHTTEKAIRMLRFKLVDVTDQFDSRTVRSLENEARWIKGRFLVKVRGHVLPLVDGIVHDWTQGRLHRIVAVYQLVEVDAEFHARNVRP